MPRMRIVPAHDDPHHSVDLLDVDRRNEWGTYYCVAPAILLEQVAERWEEYLAYLRTQTVGRGEEG